MLCDLLFDKNWYQTCQLYIQDQTLQSCYWAYVSVPTIFTTNITYMTSCLLQGLVLAANLIYNVQSVTNHWVCFTCYKTVAKHYLGCKTVKTVFENSVWLDRVCLQDQEDKTATKWSTVVSSHNALTMHSQCNMMQHDATWCNMMQYSWSLSTQCSLLPHVTLLCL